MSPRSESLRLAVPMPLVTLDTLPAEGALLALDPGAKRLGVAVCDPRRTLASPLETIHRGKFADDSARIFSLFDHWGCSAIIVGLPLNTDGSEGPRAQSARALARNLMKLRDLPVALEDERFSSQAADEAMIEAGVKPGKRAAQRDARAAAVILEAVLQRLEA